MLSKQKERVAQELAALEAEVDALVSPTVYVWSSVSPIEYWHRIGACNHGQLASQDKKLRRKSVHLQLPYHYRIRYAPLLQPCRSIICSRRQRDQTVGALQARYPT